MAPLSRAIKSFLELHSHTSCMFSIKCKCFNKYLNVVWFSDTIYKAESQTVFYVVVIYLVTYSSSFVVSDFLVFSWMVSFSVYYFDIHWRATLEKKNYCSYSEMWANNFWIYERMQFIPRNVLSICVSVLLFSNKFGCNNTLSSNDFHETGLNIESLETSLTPYSLPLSSTIPT